MTGLIGLSAYALNATDTPAAAMPTLIQTILPVGLRGIVMAAMVSIILSAADGFLNSAAVGLVCDTLLPLRPGLSDKTQLFLLRAVNLITGLTAVAVAFAVPDIFEILVLAYSFWCPLILVPLAAAFLGVQSDGRAFRSALIVPALHPCCGTISCTAPSGSTARWWERCAICWSLPHAPGSFAAVILWRKGAPLLRPSGACPPCSISPFGRRGTGQTRNKRRRRSG